MTKDEVREKFEKGVLVMRRTEGFYFIAALPDVDLRKQARDNALANPGTLSVESVFGEVLWTRPDDVIEAETIYG